MNITCFHNFIQLRKKYDRRPLLSILQDKYELKHFFVKHGFGEYVLDTLQVHDNASNLYLTHDCMIKPNNSCGRNIWYISGYGYDMHGRKYTIDEIKTHVNKTLCSDYGKLTGETAYSQIVPKVITEPLLTTNILDLKMFVVYGEILLNVVIKDCQNPNNSDNITMTYYDKEWNYINKPILRLTKLGTDLRNKPVYYDKLKEIIYKLFKNLDFVRVDWLISDDNCYISECTMYPGGGYIYDREFDKLLVSKIGKFQSFK